MFYAALDAIDRLIRRAAAPTPRAGRRAVGAAGDAAPTGAREAPDHNEGTASAGEAASAGDDLTPSNGDPSSPANRARDDIPRTDTGVVSSSGQGSRGKAVQRPTWVKVAAAVPAAIACYLRVGLPATLILLGVGAVMAYLMTRFIPRHWYEPVPTYAAKVSVLIYAAILTGVIMFLFYGLGWRGPVEARFDREHNAQERT